MCMCCPLTFFWGCLSCACVILSLFFGVGWFGGLSCACVVLSLFLREMCPRDSACEDNGSTKKIQHMRINQPRPVVHTCTSTNHDIHQQMHPTKYKKVQLQHQPTTPKKKFSPGTCTSTNHSKKRVQSPAHAHQPTTTKKVHWTKHAHQPTQPPTSTCTSTTATKKSSGQHMHINNRDKKKFHWPAHARQPSTISGQHLQIHQPRQKKIPVSSTCTQQRQVSSTRTSTGISWTVHVVVDFDEVEQSEYTMTRFFFSLLLFEKIQRKRRNVRKEKV